MSETYYTIKELAERAKVSQDTIARRMKEIPNLEVVKFGRAVRVPEDQADLILKRVKKNSRG